ncbi:uncharacterized protein LOC124133985 [Haliotis rufescens]|uniref:uncharacterized protein LOC124133985 n=1 Tax=Haliotis rufescens TaxID=6454 RepID=UPI00201E97E7|nr:uncharacterized protein LOC124133985 [Haliotis rufescens]
MASRLFLCLLLQAIVTVFGYPSTDSIDDYCGSTVYVSDSTILKLRSWDWPIQDTCSVTFTTINIYHTNSYLSVQFLDIDLNGDLSGSCTLSRVDVMDTSGNSLSRSSGTCGYSTPYDQPWTSTGDSVVVKLKRLQPGQSGTFKILVTQFAYGTCDSYGEFECGNGRCVDEDVKCDGYDDCTDDSDEIAGCSWAPGVVAGVSISVICLVLIFIGIVVAVFRRRTYGNVFGRSNVTYNSTSTVQGSTVLGSQYGVQNPAPVYSMPPPPYSAPPPSYSATGKY